MVRSEPMRRSVVVPSATSTIDRLAVVAALREIGLLLGLEKAEH